jgi:sugar-specific transcriptional regulator TrmB
MEEKLLEALGLSHKEMSLYRAVLRVGEVTPAALAKTTGVKRTTAYSMARGLVERGLLREDTTRRPRVFLPATPKEVLALIGQEKKRLEEKEAVLKGVAEALEKHAAQTKYPVPTLRFIEEAKIERFLHHQAPAWDKSMLKNNELTWWGFQDHTFVEHFGYWIKKYWKTAPKELDVKLLSNRAPAEIAFAEAKIERRMIKYWGEATNFLSTTWAIGDYVVMINTRNRPCYLVEIHDKLMAHHHREVFRHQWPLV